MPAKRDAAIGFSVHTGWASLVAVTGHSATPEVIDRRRLELLDGADADARRFVYHAASELDARAAAQLVKRETAATHKTTVRGLRAAVAELEERGFRVARAGVIGSAAKGNVALAKILASHSAIHAAEGVLYRHAIVAACDELGIKSRVVAARELAAEAARVVGIAADRMQTYAAGMKKTVGSPWAQDQKQAMLTAWLALVEIGVKSRTRSR